jgi:serine/threonine protein kinase
MSAPSVVENLFLAAVEKATSAERAAFLDEACQGDTELRQRIERLLAAHPKAVNFLDQPAYVEPGTEAEQMPRPRRTAHYVPTITSGMVIAGKYALVEIIGEGGMGEVWVAKQAEPVKRKVALKLIKAGMDSRAVLQRFEVERQALALMDHPNIARVIDGGLTDDRRPFFVMELVNGLPLTRFCDDAKLTPRDRLELFVSICQAVQHAHQKGIVHRDLKPANILVTLIDGRPVPKIIDFGVAKAIGGKLTDESITTQFGAVVGTLEYMSPEQAGFSGSDIDTRADVYSLGVILYELLTGLRPIDANRLRRTALTEMIRIIQEEEPSKPSTRLSTDAALPSLAALRQMEPNQLMAILRGELDWVVMKCLEKQRDRRYETANELARDVRRYLADEPVEARPPSARYRLRKFLQRNKGFVVAASLVFLALLAGIVGTTWGMMREAERAESESQAKLDAEKAEKLAGRRLVEIELEQTRTLDQKRRAETARDRTRQALDDMTSVFTEEALATQKSLTAEQRKFLTTVLTYYKEFAGERADDERTQARAAMAAMRVGAIQLRLGRHAEAEKAYHQARDAYRDLIAKQKPKVDYPYELAGAHNHLGIIAAEREQFKLALAEHSAALELTLKIAKQFPDHLHYLGLAAARHNNVANVHMAMKNRPEAERHYLLAIKIQEVLAAKQVDDGPEPRLYLARSYSNLSTLLEDLRGVPSSDEPARKAHAVFEKLVQDYPDHSQVREGLALSHYRLGNYLVGQLKLDEALAPYGTARKILEPLVRQYPGPPEYRHELANVHRTMGRVLLRLNKFTDAETSFRLALPLLSELDGESGGTPSHRQDLASTHEGMTQACRELNRLPEALVHARKALALRRKLDADSQNTREHRQRLAKATGLVGQMHEKLNNWDDAARHLAEANEILVHLYSDLPDDHASKIRIGGDYCNLAIGFDQRKRPAEALPYFDKAVQYLSAAVKRDPKNEQARWFLGNSYSGRALSLHRLKKYDEALADADKAIEYSLAKALLERRYLRVKTLARLGRMEKAVSEMDEIVKAKYWSVAAYYDFACYYSLASDKVAEKRTEYADRAMELLHKAVARGFLNVELMQKDSDLDPIRGREDFKNLMTNLATKSSG